MLHQSEVSVDGARLDAAQLRSDLAQHLHQAQHQNTDDKVLTLQLATLNTVSRRAAQRLDGAFYYPVRTHGDFRQKNF